MIKLEKGKCVIAGIPFVKTGKINGNYVLLAESPIKNMAFGKTSNFAQSDVLLFLNEDVLPEIEKTVGSENIAEFETDLLSHDGIDTYGRMTSKISIPTFDFMRKHARSIDKLRKKEGYEWTATPDTTAEHIKDVVWITVFSPAGGVYFFEGDCPCCGVRPLLHLKPTAFAV